MTEEQQKMVADMQEEMFAYGKAIMPDNPKTEYQDVCNVFLLMKIAELQEEIQYLRHNLASGLPI